MSKSTGVLRLQKEYMQIAKRTRSYDNYFAVPESNNFFNWYYIIWDLKDCPYEGGYYFGRIIFPKQYPLKPPGIEMISASGRF